jgi:hypothetical protein
LFPCITCNTAGVAAIKDGVKHEITTSNKSGPFFLLLSKESNINTLAIMKKKAVAAKV